MVYGRLVKGRLDIGRLIKDGWSTDDLIKRTVRQRTVGQTPSNEEINVRHCEAYSILTRA